jgi:hypothetical protein
MPKSNNTVQPYVMNEEQAACLASPIRRELVSVFQSDSPCSVSHVASTLGKPENATYYHVNRLVQCGLLVQAGEIGEGREKTALYKLVANSIAMPEKLKDAEIVKKSVRSVFSLAERELLRSLQSVDYRVLHDNLFTLTRASARLNDETKQKVMHMLWEATKYAKEHQDPDGEITALTLCVAPIVSKKQLQGKPSRAKKKRA